MERTFTEILISRNALDSRRNLTWHLSVGLSDYKWHANSKVFPESKDTVLAQTAIAEYYRLVAYVTDIYFAQLWRLWCSCSRCWQIWFLVRALLQTATFSLCAHLVVRVGRRETETERHTHRGLSVAAAGKSLQSCPTLCDPIDGSPPSSPVPGILQARTLEWVSIAFSSAWK